MPQSSLSPTAVTGRATSARPAAQHGAIQHSALQHSSVPPTRGLRSSTAVWIGWLVAMAFQFWILCTYRWGTEDLVYYRNGSLLSGSFGGHIVGIGGAPTPLSEYPHAGVWPILGVKKLADLFFPGSEIAFILIFAGMCALLSAGFTGFLLRRGIVLGAWTWVAVCLCIGPILITRLDIIPGLAVGIAIAIAATHPRISGGLLAFATASKLWPGVLASTLVGHWRARGTWVRLGSFAATLAVLLGITAVTEGPARILSPLDYQDDRGLQVESIAATPFTLLSAFDERWDVHLSASKSYEVTGPGVGVAMHAASAVMALTLLLAVGIALRHFLRGGWTSTQALASATMLVTLLLVANKVFSPQYVLWLAPLVCLAMPPALPRRGSRAQVAQDQDAQAPDSPVQDARPRLTLGLLTIVIAALSFLVFPTTYGWLVAEGPRIVPASILVLRNALCIAAAVVAVRWWWAHTKAQPANP